MAQAISSSLAQAAPNGGNRSPAIGAEKPEGQAVQSSPQQPEASQRSPATMISLSPEAWDTLRTELSSLPALPEYSAPEIRDLSKIGEARQIKAALNKLDELDKARGANTETLNRFQANYEKLRDTPPKPAVVLNEEEKAKALKLLKEAGLTLAIPKDGNYGFGKDGVIYMFKSDGTVTAEEDGVATSQESQQQSLARYTDMISRQQNLLRDTSSERTALLARQGALLGEAVAAA
jgi:hypothetical protein